MADKLSIRRSGDAHRDELSVLLNLAFDRALARESYISQDALALPGMSGAQYRMFINNLIRMLPNSRYLEVGSWKGSTSCAAMDKNVAKVVCIDNWSEFGGPKDDFIANTNRFRSDNIDFTFIESDFRAVAVGDLGKFNVYLFDGPHQKKDQYDGLDLYRSALDQDIVFIVDDWNWPFVRSGTLEAIRDIGARIDFAIEVRTTQNDEHALTPVADWHNGYFISKLSMG